MKHPQMHKNHVFFHFWLYFQIYERNYFVICVRRKTHGVIEIELEIPFDGRPPKKIKNACAKWKTYIIGNFRFARTVFNHDDRGRGFDGDGEHDEQTRIKIWCTLMCLTLLIVFDSSTSKLITSIIISIQYQSFCGGFTFQLAVIGFCFLWSKRTPIGCFIQVKS